MLPAPRAQQCLYWIVPIVVMEAVVVEVVVVMIVVVVAVVVEVMEGANGR